MDDVNDNDSDESGNNNGDDDGNNGDLSKLGYFKIEKREKRFSMTYLDLQKMDEWCQTADLYSSI